MSESPARAPTPALREGTSPARSPQPGLQGPEYVPTDARRRANGQAPRSSRRVLLAADTFPPDVNGAAQFTFRLADALAARGHDIHILCQSDTGRPREERVGGATVHRLRSLRLVGHATRRIVVPLGLSRAVNRLVDRLAPDVVHAQSHFAISRAAMLAARRAGIPLVVTNHFMPENLYQFLPVPAWLNSLFCAVAWRDCLRTLRRADLVTTPTRIAADLLTHKGITRPVEPVSCGIDLARFRPLPEGPCSGRARLGLPDRRTAVFVGRLEEEKGVHDAVRALPQVLDRVDAQLVLVGTGSQRASLEQLAEDLDVRERVHFLGVVPDHDLPLVYGAAEVFVMPSIAELQSIATLEALACGLPAVAADAMALPHLVHHGQNGWLYPPGDVSALADHLATTLDSPEQRARMGGSSLRIAADHDHESSVRRYEEIYARLHEHSPASSSSPSSQRRHP